MLKLKLVPAVKAGLDYTLLEFIVRELPETMACSLLQSLKTLLKDPVITTGEKEIRLLRTREYLCREVKRRKDETDRFDSSLVIDHGAALQLHNIERPRAINIVPVR